MMKTPIIVFFFVFFLKVSNILFIQFVGDFGVHTSIRIAPQKIKFIPIVNRAY